MGLMHRQITGCRICGSEWLDVLLDLGTQFLTGVFPRSVDESLTKGPLTLVRCDECGLVQLLYSYERTELYGAHYGYRSSLNRKMVSHLEDKARMLLGAVDLRPDDVIVDIGSNDGTLLSFFSGKNLCLLGVDPSAARWRGGYPVDSRLIADFFSANLVRSALGGRKARIVTSIAMFYDLERPLDFAHEVADILADDGIWHFEQSYMPSMLRLNSYDTICHEHLEYYSLGVIKTILQKSGLRLVDVVMNSVNGGSFAVTAAKASNRSVKTNQAVIDWLLEQEDRMGLNTPRPYRDFEERVFRHRDDLTRLIRTLNADGKTVLGYGASTKGNVVLQFCGFTAEDIPMLAEVNQEKFGHVTPGTHIPIVSEIDARAMKPDYFLVLPWHFKDGILRREKEYLANGGKFIFPFPEIEIV